MRKGIVMVSLTLVLMISLGVLGLPECAATPKGDATGVSDKVIKIGYIGDMTGPVASATTPFREGIELYLRFINNEKGGVFGRTIQFIPEDDRWQVPLAIAAFRKLVDRDEIFAILGQAGSSQIAALDSDIQKERIPVFGPQQTIDIQIKNPFIYCMMASYEDECKVAVKYALDQLAKDKKEPRIAAFTIKVESGYEWAKVAESELSKRGLKLVAHETIASSAVEAVSQINALLKVQPNYVLFHSGPAQAVVYLKEAQRYGLSVPIISSYGPFYAHVFKSVSEEVGHKFAGTQSFNPAYMPGRGLEELRQLTEKYGKMENLDAFSYVCGYTVAKVFVEALHRAGQNLTRESLAAAIETLKDFDTAGLSAPVKFGSGDTHGISASRIFGFDYKSDRIIPLTDWIEP